MRKCPPTCHNVWLPAWASSLRNVLSAHRGRSLSGGREILSEPTILWARKSSQRSAIALAGAALPFLVGGCVRVHHRGGDTAAV